MDAGAFLIAYAVISFLASLFVHQRLIGRQSREMFSGTHFPGFIP
jgi:hypothetical protein